MKNRKMIICISVITAVLLVGAGGLLGISKLLDKKVDTNTTNPTTATPTTTLEVATTEITTEVSEEKQPETTTKKAEEKTTTKNATTDKTTKRMTTKKQTTPKTNNATTTKKTTGSIDVPASKPEPVCKNYNLPKGAVLYKDFGEDGTTAMSNEYLEVHKNLNSFSNEKLFDIIDEYESWFEYDYDNKYSDGIVEPVFCSDGYHVRGITARLTIHSISQKKDLAIGYIKPDKSMKWTYKDTTCPAEMCKLKD